MTDSREIPLGHSTPSHRVLGWCSHCPGRSLAEEVAAWQVDALDRTATTASGGDDRDAGVERLRTENERMRHELEVMYGGAFDSPPTDGPADLRGRVAVLEALVGDFIDPDPCHFDHHGYCQAHGWFATDPGCPHGRAKALGLEETEEAEA